MNWQWANNESTAIFGSWNDLPVNGQSFGPPGPYFGIIELPFNATVPEPASIIMAGVGLVGVLGMALASRRRKRLAEVGGFRFLGLTRTAPRDP